MRRLGLSLLSLGVAACGSTPVEEPQFQPWTLPDLTDEEGLSLRLPAEDIPAATESQNCYFIRVPDLNGGKDFFVEKVHMAINPGSHHMNVFRVKTIGSLRPEDGEPIKIGPYDATLVKGYDDFFGNPCWDSAAWADWPLVANSQNSEPENPYTEWQLPENVGIRFSPGEMLMIQTHYVNTSIQAAPAGGKVGINFHRWRGADEPMEMGSLFATKQTIRVCRSQGTAQYSGTCSFPPGQQVTISAANGHFHSRGKKFSIYTWDGQSITQPPAEHMFYESSSWDHPPMTTGIDVPAPMGGGVWYTCDFQWLPPTPGTCDEVDAKDPEKAGDCCYTFGGNTDVGEHCNVFLYYYPRVDENDVFCN